MRVLPAAALVCSAAFAFRSCAEGREVGAACTGPLKTLAANSEPARSTVTRSRASGVRTELRSTWMMRKLRHHSRSPCANSPGVRTNITLALPTQAAALCISIFGSVDTAMVVAGRIA